MAGTQRIREVGGFPEIGTVSDLGLRLLLASSGGVACLPLPLIQYRVHGSNLSGKTADVVASFLEFVRWARSRSELGVYMSWITAFACRGITGYGLRSAIQGDEGGTAASLAALGELELSAMRKTILRSLIQSGKRGMVRKIMEFRDAAIYR
jgi:hypothetical protein